MAKWLLRDDQPTMEDGPAQPGPGYRTVIDTDGGGVMFGAFGLELPVRPSDIVHGNPSIHIPICEAMDGTRRLLLVLSPFGIVLIERGISCEINTILATARPDSIEMQPAIRDEDGHCVVENFGKVEIRQAWPSWVLRDRFVRRWPRWLRWLARWMWREKPGVVIEGGE